MEQSDDPDSAESPFESGELFQSLLTELRALAVRQMSCAPGPGHTLQPTALVHEAWLRIGASEKCKAYNGQEHFMAVAAKTMRSILVDHARRKGSEKRSACGSRIPLSDVLPVFEQPGLDLVMLDDALERLGERDERRARVVELRFFGGLTITETADALGTSPATVDREWRMARTWLLDELGLV